MASVNTHWWIEGLTEQCVQFQIDLSCLVDGELEEAYAARAIAHLEECGACSEFFEDTRRQVRANRDMADPVLLMERYSMLVGDELEAEVSATELVDRLAGIFYQLGKAYLLTEIDPDFRTRVFEKAVEVSGTQVRGRGFVDGVVESGRGQIGGVNWADARHMLNGRLSRIEGAGKKGRRLLEEALSVDPDHEEARVYIGFADLHEGRTLRAANAFQRVFRTATRQENRGHAAVQLGLMHAQEGEFKRAIACFRWIVASGLADREPRFFFVRFNIGMYYAHLRQPARSLAAFRRLLDLHSDRMVEVAGFFSRSPQLRAVIDAQPGFAEGLLNNCPELFVAGESDPGSEETL